MVNDILFWAGLARFGFIAFVEHSTVEVAAFVADVHAFVELHGVGAGRPYFVMEGAGITARHARAFVLRRPMGIKKAGVRRLAAHLLLNMFRSVIFF